MSYESVDSKRFSRLYIANSKINEKQNLGIAIELVNSNETVRKSCLTKQIYSEIS